MPTAKILVVQSASVEYFVSIRNMYSMWIHIGAQQCISIQLK